jgi:hypothetical protein
MARGVFVGATVSTATALNDAFKPPYAYVYNSANLSIPNATATAVTFDSEVTDNLSMHSTVSNTGRLNVPSGGAGIYLVGFTLRFATNATGLRQLEIRQGGTPILIHRVPAITGDQSYITCSTMTPAADFDIFEFYAYQSSGGALNVETVGRYGIGAWAQWVAVS